MPAYIREVINIPIENLQKALKNGIFSPEK